MTKIIIFGGGIAGLTVAHELIEKRFKVTLIEPDQILGGMARSRRENNGIPSEHSWRGYGSFYSNTFDILKRIPIECKSEEKELSLNKNFCKTVYDNLSLGIKFYIAKDEIDDYKSKLSFSDNIFTGYVFFKYLFSDLRREQYFKEKIVDILQSNLSPDGRRYLIDFVCGPGYGLEEKDASYAHYFKLLSIHLLNQSIYKQKHSHPIEYTTSANSKWHVMNQPINEAWFDPWEKYLLSRGVNIIKGLGLKKIYTENNKVIGCLLTNNKLIKGDEYILCINPFVSQTIFENSGLLNLTKIFSKINYLTDSRQVSFRLGFNKKIKFPEKNIAFIFPDSEFNITLYPQEESWEQDIKLDNNSQIKSLWSGTILELYKYSKIFQTQGFNLTKDQLMQEIIYQVFRSKSLQKLLFDSNGFELKSSDIIYTEIWYEWYIDKQTSQLEQTNKKWITNIYNQSSRPGVKTEFSNLYLGGSHINTTIEIWSMEGAVESGKMISNSILTKYNKPLTYIQKHTDPNWTNLPKSIDNLLYKLYLPNLIDCIIIIIIIIIICMLLKKK